MVSSKPLAMFLIILGMLTFCGNSFAKQYNYESSEKIILKGTILHAGNTAKGEHTFTVSYKGKLYFCYKTFGVTECHD